MVRPFPFLPSGPTTSLIAKRSNQIRLGVWIELVTIVWMTIEASVALSVGLATTGETCNCCIGEDEDCSG